MTNALDDDWYLREWMDHFAKNQTALVTEVGLNKSTANFVWHGRQPYRRDLVNKIAAWLSLRPFELLMPPGEALALRGMREMALAIAAEPDRTFTRDDAPEGPAAGRGGQQPARP